MTKAPVTKAPETKQPAWLGALTACRVAQPTRPLFLLAGQSNAGWPLSAFAQMPTPLPNNSRFSLVQHSANGAITQLNWTTDLAAPISALSYFTAAALTQTDGGQTGSDYTNSDWLDISYPGSALSAWTPAEATATAPAHHWQAGALWQQSLLPALQLKPCALIWYQGEQDAMAKTVDAEGYQQQLQQWLNAVRQHYDGPIIAVQLAGFGAYATASAKADSAHNARAGFAAIRQAQLLVFASPRLADKITLDTGKPITQLVSAADLGHASDIHLGDKQQLGQRLAAALQQQAPLTVATLDWDLWQLVFPPGDWQTGRLTAEGSLMLSAQPNEAIPLLGWLQDGTMLALSAEIVEGAKFIAADPPTRRWQIGMPSGIDASQITAIAYGWANQPDLSWYLPSKDAAGQTLYWPLLPQRWQRGQ